MPIPSGRLRDSTELHRRRGCRSRTAPAGVGCTLVVMAIGCAQEIDYYAPLPQRNRPPDTIAISPRFAASGGPVLLHLTSWANARVLEEVVAAGMRPLPGYSRVERLDSMGLNLVGGVVPSEVWPRIRALRWVVRIEPLE